MEQLNDFLRQFVSQNAETLCLEPNKSPYLTTTGGNVNVSDAPIQGAQINSMVFALIPPDVQKELPNQQEVQFSHPHTLGSFDFRIKKSPSGFNVTINRSADATPQIDAQEKPAPSSQEIENIIQELNEVEALSKPVPTAPVESIPSENFDIEIIETNGAKPEQNPTIKSQLQVDQPVIETFEPQIDLTPMQNNIPNQIPQMPPPTVPQQTVAAPLKNPAATANPQAQARMDSLFKAMADKGASDLHMSVSMPPMIRKDGKMAKLDESVPQLTADSIKELLHSIMPQKNIEEFDRRNDTDFAYEIKGLARFRANIFMDRKGMGGVFRIIPSDIMTAEDLNLSRHIMDLCDLSKGLVVVTGPTGSGKSTTLCAMVDAINKKREDHIITIEDPIEFTHENQKCLVNQREVHNHTSSFKDALRAALREDPDILLVGEMRDLETISIAIETAETGHLVFGTLHTTTAASTVDRIIDQFPADRQQQVRVMLSESLRGVIAQTLLPKIGGGRIAALEVLIVNPAISNLIREGKTFQIPSAMQTGKSKGMVMLNDALMDLVLKKQVEPRDAYIKAVDKTGFEMLLDRNGLKI